MDERGQQRKSRHHAHVAMTAGDSIRLTQATAPKGVTPLAN